MRVYYTVLWRLAQASRSSIPETQLWIPEECCAFPQECRGKEAFALCGFLPP